MQDNTNGYITPRPAKIVVLGAGNIGEEVWKKLTSDNVAANVVVWNRTDKMEKDLLEGKQDSRNQVNIIEERVTSPQFDFDSKDKSHLLMGIDRLEEALKGADIIINAMGEARNPTDPNRNALLVKNYEKIIHAYAEKIGKAARESNAIVISATNPVDTLTQVLAEEGNIDRHRIVGLSGELDRARFIQSASKTLGIANSQEDMEAMHRRGQPKGGYVDPKTFQVIGEHGEYMIPIVSKAVTDYPQGIIPLAEHDMENVKKIVDDTVNGGTNILKKLGKSDYEAPAAAIVKMTKAIIAARQGECTDPIYCSSYNDDAKLFIGQPVKFKLKRELVDGKPVSAVSYEAVPIRSLDLADEEKEKWGKAVDKLRDTYRNKVPRSQEFAEATSAAMAR